jgi:hypothetical protein
MGKRILLESGDPIPNLQGPAVLIINFPVIDGGNPKLSSVSTVI